METTATTITKTTQDVTDTTATTLGTTTTTNEVSSSSSPSSPQENPTSTDLAVVSSPNTNHQQQQQQESVTTPVATEDEEEDENEDEEEEDNNKEEETTKTTTTTISNRRSRRNRQSYNNPIIAPGFGTAKDIQRLSIDLGGTLPVAAVEAIMQSRGRGIRRSRRSGGGNGDDDDDEKNAGATSTTNPLASPGTSSAWAAFLKEEGTTVTLQKGHGGDNNDDDLPDGERSTRKRKQDKKEAAAAAASTTDSGSGGLQYGENDDDDSGEYDLSILQQIHNPTTTAVAASATKKKKTADDETTTKTFGSLVQSGTLDSTLIGRKGLPKAAAEGHVQHLIVPTILLPKIAITKVFASCNSAHAVAIDTGHNLYGWGRNDQYQLGNSFGENCKMVITPQIIGHDFITAAVGKSHTLAIKGGSTTSGKAEQGKIYAMGSNKVGQCGWKPKQTSSGTWKISLVGSSTTATAKGSSDSSSSPIFVQVACGEEFSLALDINGDLYSTGSSQYGQLGTGETGEYFVSANKLAYSNCYGWQRQAMFHIEEQLEGGNYSSVASSRSIKTKPIVGGPLKLQHIACGKHHAVAVEAPRIRESNGTFVEPRVITWGCGDYGCLGHGRQHDEYYPRVLTTLPTGTMGERVAAGSQFTLLQTTSGHVYFWGKMKSGSAGEAKMRPTLVEELANNAHVVTHCAAGSSSIACSTTLGDVIVWGSGPYGELGLGGTKKSSARPAFVESLAPPSNPRPLLSLACGQGSLLAVIDEGKDHQLPILDVQAVEEAMADVLASNGGGGN